MLSRLWSLGININCMLYILLMQSLILLILKCVIKNCTSYDITKFPFFSKEKKNIFPEMGQHKESCRAWESYTWSKKCLKCKTSKHGCSSSGHNLWLWGKFSMPWQTPLPRNREKMRQTTGEKPWELKYIWQCR